LAKREKKTWKAIQEKEFITRESEQLSTSESMFNIGEEKNSQAVKKKTRPLSVQ
jgi:hypothetical protein